MSEGVVGAGSSVGKSARAALSAAGALWFLTAVLGQWTFVYYIAGFYGPATLSGHFEAWARNKSLIDGYLVGDAIGNVFFGAHVLIAAVLIFGGALQLVPQVRARAIGLHRWNGRVFLVAATLAASAGLYLQWVRGTAFRGGRVEALGLTLDGLLILTFSGLAWRAVRRREIATHRIWAMRLFLAVSGVWFLRIGVRAWLLMTAGVFGVQPFFRFWSFGAYLIPLAVYELYRRANSATAPAQGAVAAGLIALTLVMAVGEVATFLHSWRPLLASLNGPGQ